MRFRFKLLIGLTTAGLLTIGAAGSALGATAATLDPAFGSNGSVTTDFGGADQVQDIAVMPDGRFVVAGNSNGKIALARYLPSGALDPTFSGDGKLVTSGYTDTDLALQPDGKILVWGSALLRYTKDGLLDPTFGPNGVVPTSDPGLANFADVIVRHDGTIATLGTTLLTVYSSKGSVLASTDVNGAGSGYRTLAEQSDGSLLAGSASDCGCSFVARWVMPNLQQDNNFTTSGLNGATGVQALDVFPLSGGRVLMTSRDYVIDDIGDGGRTGITFNRYLSDGSRDTTFGSNGVVFTDTSTWPAGTASVDPISSALTPTGQILVLGSTYLARFTSSGALDKTFSGDGILPLSGATWTTLAAQRDGHVLLTGSAGGNIVVRRYLGNATITRYPATVSVDSGGGTLASGTTASLAATDSNYLQVRSTTSGTTRTSSWSATFTGVPNVLSSLKVSYAGKDSVSTTQKLSIFNYTHSTWTTLDTRTVGTSLVTITDRSVTGTLADYVSGTSGNGSVKVRVTNTAASSHTVSGDRLSIAYT